MDRNDISENVSFDGEAFRQTVVVGDEGVSSNVDHEPRYLYVYLPLNFL